jgi:hypothetical protein
MRNPQTGKCILPIRIGYRKAFNTKDVKNARRMHEAEDNESFALPVLGPVVNYPQLWAAGDLGR